MIHRLNLWSRVHLWTPILDLGGRAIHRVHESMYQNGRHATPCQSAAQPHTMFPFQYHPPTQTWRWCLPSFLTVLHFVVLLYIFHVYYIDRQFHYLHALILLIV
jgi:hypothetical protein